MSKKTTPLIDKFAKKLSALMAKHGVLMIGDFRIYNNGDFNKKSIKTTISPVRYVPSSGVHMSVDNCGPFLSITAERNEVESHFSPSKVSTLIFDKDALLKNPVKSMADGKHYSNRREWNEHLKRNDVVEVGDQAPTKAPKEIRGDYSVKNELKQAIQQHLG
jgi:hypothetical protein